LDIVRVHQSTARQPRRPTSRSVAARTSVVKPTQCRPAVPQLGRFGFTDVTGRWFGAVLYGSFGTEEAAWGSFEGGFPGSARAKARDAPRTPAGSVPGTRRGVSGSEEDRGAERTPLYGPRVSWRCHGARQPINPRSFSRARAIRVSWARRCGFRLRSQKHWTSTKTMNSVSVKFTMAVPRRRSGDRGQTPARAAVWLRLQGDGDQQGALANAWPFRFWVRNAAFLVQRPSEAVEMPALRRPWKAVVHLEPEEPNALTPHTGSREAPRQSGACR